MHPKKIKTENKKSTIAFIIKILSDNTAHKKLLHKKRHKDVIRLIASLIPSQPSDY